MKTYLLRVLKYLCYFVILFMVVYALLTLSGYNEMKETTFIDLLSSQRGLLMCLVILGMAFLYPIIGTTKKVIFDMPMEEVVEAMKGVGYHQSHIKGENSALFRADKFSERLFMKMDDGVLVEIIGNQTVFTGARRPVFKTAYTIEMKRKRYNE